MQQRQYISKSESRNILSLCPVKIFPCQNLPPIFKAITLDRAWLESNKSIKGDKRYKSGQNCVFKSLVIMAYDETFSRITFKTFQLKNNISF